jgi:ABC-type uncharacterized transport system substrate-binding protein
LSALRSMSLSGSGAYVATLKQATSVIPIVFAVAIDPLGAGFVASLAHPGGNSEGTGRSAVYTASPLAYAVHDRASASLAFHSYRSF